MDQLTKKRRTGPRDLINLRMSPQDRNIIDRAAQDAGKTRTEFMIDAARRAAHEALLDTTLILVDGQTRDQFRAMFDAPPDPPAGLRHLLGLAPPWER